MAKTIKTITPESVHIESVDTFHGEDYYVILTLKSGRRIELQMSDWQYEVMERALNK